MGVFWGRRAVLGSVVRVRSCARLCQVVHRGELSDFLGFSFTFDVAVQCSGLGRVLGG